MRLVLHIGNHKTGSTAIQTALSNSYKHLVSNGILYPKAGRVRNAHHNLVLSQTKKNIPGFEVSKSFEFYLQELLSEIKAYPGIETVIISSEEFFTLGPEDFVKFNNLFSRFDKIDIACVLRNQLDHIESSYKFSILWDRVYETRLFDEYLKFNLSSDYHKYYHKLSGLRRTGLFDRIIALSFSRIVKEGRLVSNFMTELGCFNCDLEEVNNNESLSRLGTMLLLSYDLNSPVNDISRESYIEKLRLNFETSRDSLYCIDLFEEAYTFFKRDNVSLGEEFGVDLNEPIRNKDKNTLKGFLFTYSEVFEAFQFGLQNSISFRRL